MTAVATFSVAGHPVVVGDVMVSAEPIGGLVEPFHIPTHEDVNRIAVPITGQMVVGLVQKVTVLSDRLVLAWSGRESPAHFITAELLGEDNHPSLAAIQAKLNEWVGQPKFDLFVTGLFVVEKRERSDVFAKFGWDADHGWRQPILMAGYGDCYFGGTGAGAVSKALAEREARVDGGVPVEKAVLSALGMLGRLSGDQLRLSAGVQELFGGAFECATIMKGRVQKVDDVCYHFWEVRGKDPDGDLDLHMHSILKVAYFEDYLLVGKLRMSTPHATNELFVMRPPYRTMDDNEERRLRAAVSMPDFTSRLSVFYVHLPMLRSPNDVYILTHKGAQGTSAIEFTTICGGLELTINADVITRIRAYMRRSVDASS